MTGLGPVLRDLPSGDLHGDLRPAHRGFEINFQKSRLIQAQQFICLGLHWDAGRALLSLLAPSSRQWGGAVPPVACCDPEAPQEGTRPSPIRISGSPGVADVPHGPQPNLKTLRTSTVQRPPEFLLRSPGPTTRTPLSKAGEAIPIDLFRAPGPHPDAGLSHQRLEWMAVFLTLHRLSPKPGSRIRVVLYNQTAVACLQRGEVPGRRPSTT